MRTGNSHSYLVKDPYSYYFRIKVDTYVKRGKMSRLHKVLVEHLDYRLDLSHLKNCKWVVQD